VASKTNDMVGDGTTTSVVLAEALLEEGISTAGSLGGPRRWGRYAWRPA
jgi:hypothetical protein